MAGYGFEGTNAKPIQRDSIWQSFCYRAQKYLAQMTGVGFFSPKDPLEIEPPPPTHLDQWKAAMDWSHLEQLEIQHVSQNFLAGMTGQLPRLQSLGLGIDRCQEQRRNGDHMSIFLTALPALSDLSLFGYTDLLNWTEALSQHCGKLTRLEIHSSALSDPGQVRPTLSTSQLQQINDVCPHLEEFEMDVNRNGTWPLETFDTLANFREVRKFTLWLQLSAGQSINDFYDYDILDERVLTEDDFQQPRLNASSVLALFKYIRSRKDGVPLDMAAFYILDWERDRDEELIYTQNELLYQEARYECNTKDEDGQDKPEGMAWCIKYHTWNF